MKYAENEILYYVCPFSFIIELVKIEIGLKEIDGLYYIDESGAYLKEENLFRDISDAQEHAFKLLTKFYYEKTYHILYDKPKRGKEL